MNIVDAYFVMNRNGPRGGSNEDVLTLKSQIISTDIVAADSAAAKLFGKEPSEIGYIKIANDMKIGTMDLSKLKINRIILWYESSNPQKDQSNNFVNIFYFISDFIFRLIIFNSVSFC